MNPTNNFPDFLPPEAEQLVEPESIALARCIQRRPIATPLSAAPIVTSYVKQGEGETPLLLIHGFDSSVMEFRRLLPLLANHAETWAVDVLGFGFTERRADVPIDPAAIATHLHAFWKAVIDRPVVLVGASMGGAIAIDFACTYPDSVKQLVLLDSAGFAKGPAIGKFLVPPLGWLATEFLRNPRVRSRISENAYYDKNLNSPDAQCCAALHLRLPRWSQATIAFTKSGGYPLMTDKIAQIAQPTLILWGQNDRILGTEDATKFERTIPHSQLVWVPQCGHVPHLEKPNFVAEEILQFIGCPFPDTSQCSG